MNGIDLGRIGDGDEEHVGLVDRLPAADRRAVETESVIEAFEGQFVDRAGGVLPESGKIHEAEIDELDFLIFAQFQDVLRLHRGEPPWFGPGMLTGWW